MRETILYGLLEFFNPVYGWWLRKNCNIYFLEKIHETTGMSIPSMSRTFESYSGAFCTLPFIATSQKGSKCI
jgi:hypothetical protein